MADKRSQVDIERRPPLELVEEAKNIPGGWVYEIEGEFGPDDAVPPHAIRGAWAVDEHGHPTGEFIPNPNYRRKE